MWINLTDDNGVLIERWYVSAKEHTPNEISDAIQCNANLSLFDSPDERDQVMAELNDSK
jgi:hypothetical protein